MAGSENYTSILIKHLRKGKSELAVLFLAKIILPRPGLG